MFRFERGEVEKVLLWLFEETDFRDLSAPFRLRKEHNGLTLLGVGGTSYVYEMYDEKTPDRGYVLKVIGFGEKQMDPKLVSFSVMAQYRLSEQSINIARPIALWNIKILLDENGMPQGWIGESETAAFEKSEGRTIHMILMDKLDPVLEHNKFGNVEILREELKTEEGILRFTKQVGRALFTVHENSFLHRDVKLENIFWDPKSEQYQLGDFGISKYVDDGNAETVVYTDGYGAPEIERRLRESYNASADIYSFGMTLFLLCNDLKFPGSDSYHVNPIQYENGFVLPPPEHASPEFARIIRKMCSYHPEERYQSVEEVLMELGRLDGSYSEKGFEESFEDMETETYREPDENPDEDTAEDTGKIPWWQKNEWEMTRYERKQSEIELEKMYKRSAVFGTLIFAVFLLLSLNSFVSDTGHILCWHVLLLPLAATVESILLRIRECHISFGFVTIGLAVASMVFIGRPGLLQILLIIVTVSGTPALAAGYALGTGLWIVQILTGKCAWLASLGRLPLGWIFLIGMAAVALNLVIRRLSYRNSHNG